MLMQKRSQREWIVVSCECSPSEEETCSWLFFQNQTLGLEIENISNETVRLKASFAAENLSPEDLEDLSHRFMQAGFDRAADTLKAEPIADQDWMSNWKKYFMPFTIGDSLSICPPWHIDKTNTKEFQHRKKIIIDPGMAFGTGLHATTKFCLHAIEKWGQGPNVLDIGTGSGILAIASAILLPASHIVALDIDENAIANATHNIELNHLKKSIELRQASPDTFAGGQFDTLLSNLTVEAIIDLLPIYNKLLAPDGILILAGIIEERLSLLKGALSAYGWQKLEQAIDRGWVGIVLRKSGT